MSNASDDLTDKVIDVRGLFCPEPVFRTKMEMERLHILVQEVQEGYWFQMNTLIALYINGGVKKREYWLEQILHYLMTRHLPIAYGMAKAL